MSTQRTQDALTERELWRRACADDVDAYAAFVRLCERRVRAVLGRLLDDARDVDEATQDTFVQAWRYRHRFRGGARPFTWLYRIAVNEAGQRNRRVTRETGRIDDRDELRAAASSVADVAETRELAQALLAGLKGLAFEQRCAVVLRDIEGCANQEVADVLGVSVAAAKARIHRGRAQLRKEVEPRLLRMNPRRPG